MSTGIPSTARVVVIGGGVVGVSALYHLAKKGWSDCVLLERTELTAGSTWHAAGLLPLFNVSYSVGQLHQYSVELYDRLEDETGQAVSFHNTGNLRLAMNKERMDEYHWYRCTADTIGVESHMLTVEEIKNLWPLIQTDGLVGALWHPTDGHIAPVDLTQSLAKGARSMGAQIFQRTVMSNMERTDAGEWVVTYHPYGEPENTATITCEHVICATGNYARETALKVGLEIPAIPVEHQYIVTGEDPVLMDYRAAGNKELPVLRQSDSSWYLREERGGWILGPYEEGAPARFADGVPDWFEKDLFEGELERLIPHVETCMERVPSFENGGIKQIVNGPISYAPDGNPMVGPAFGIPNMWISEAHSFGVTAAGGAGWQLANWIVDGEPSVDMLGVDPRRFGVVTKHFTKLKNEEAYSHVFVNHFPMEERPAGRGARTIPVHQKLVDAGAVMGARFGWERPNWFAKNGEKAEDVYSYRRSNWWEPVKREVHTMRERVGLLELSGFSKFEIEGSGARGFLDNLVANAIPQKQGSVRLAHALNPSGSVRSEFTITKLSDGQLGERFYAISGGAAHDFDLDYLIKSAPRDGSVYINDVTTQYGVFVLAGPDARKVLEQLADGDVSNDGFKWLTAKEMTVGFAPKVRALRVNFVGSLGWELHHPIEYQAHLYDAIMEAGKKYDIDLVGLRAMDSMRLEKSYRMWGTDLNAENSILQAGLSPFVRMNKGEFIGRDALASEKADGAKLSYVTIEVDADDADCFGNEPIIMDGKVVGRGTAGGFGHFVNKSLLLGYMDAEQAEVGAACEVRVLDGLRPAKIIPHSPFDPDNEHLRA